MEIDKREEIELEVVDSLKRIIWSVEEIDHNYKNINDENELFKNNIRANVKIILKAIDKIEKENTDSTIQTLINEAKDKINILKKNQEL